MNGPNLYLRACEPEDLENLYRWENDPEIRFAGDYATPYSRHTLAEYLNSVHDIYAQKQLRLIICRSADDTAIGTVDLFDFDARNRSSGIGILLDEAFRYKGHGTEALQIVLRYAREELGLRLLHCSMRAENLASRKLFSKSGFEDCGLRKHRFIRPDGFSDEILMQILF